MLKFNHFEENYFPQNEEGKNEVAHNDCCYGEQTESHKHFTLGEYQSKKETYLNHNRAAQLYIIQEFIVVGF